MSDGRGPHTSVGPEMDPLGWLRRHWSDPFLRNSYYLIGNLFVPAVLGLVFLRIAGEYFSLESIGLLSSLLAISNTITAGSLLGLNSAAVRFLPRLLPAERTSFMRVTMTVAFSVSVLAVLVYVSFAGRLTPQLSFVSESWQFAGVFLVTTVCASMAAMMDGFFIADGEAHLSFWKNSVGSLARVAMVLGLSKASGMFEIFLPSFVMYLLAFALGCIFFVRKMAGPSLVPLFSLGPLKGHLRYSASNYLAGFLPTVQAMAVNLIVLRFYGPKSTAIFFVATTILTIINFVPQAISNSLLAEAVRKPETFSHLLKRALAFTMILLLPVVLVLVFAPQIPVSLINREAASGIGWTVPLLALSALPSIINSLYAVQLRLLHRNAELVWFLSAATALVVAPALLFASFRLALEWIAGTYLVSQGLLLLWAVPRFTRKLSNPDPAPLVP